MKLKNIVAFAVACGAALIMSVATYAATEVKVQGATTDEYGAVVPVVLNTTDTTQTGNIASWDLDIKYDSSVWQYDSYEDPNTYTSRGKTYTKGTVFTNTANNNAGNIKMTYSCTGANGYTNVVDGSATLVIIYLSPIDSTIPDVTDNDFSVVVNIMDDEDATTGEQAYPASEMKSFFKFDVTGDLGGNEIVGLAASVDGGATMQELTKYASTTLTEADTDYTQATTTFVVSVNNTKGATGIVDVTIYGIKADGTYVPLTSYDQADFQVQNF